MHTCPITTPQECSLYDQWVKNHPQGSLWQSLEWKIFQDALGRDVQISLHQDNSAIVASALVVIDRTVFNLSTWDIPRGPLWTIVNDPCPISNTHHSEKCHVGETLLQSIFIDAQNDRCLRLYLSPPIPLSSSLSQRTAHLSHRHEQPEATRMIDLRPPEEAILAQMKPKGRYNISIAKKNGVGIAHSEDIEAFHILLEETALRQRMKKRPLEHYKTFLSNLPGSFLLLAHNTQKKPIAGLLGVLWPPTAPKIGIFYYGASSYAARASMAPYLLQWEALRFCKDRGCKDYDLLGIAPKDAPVDHPWGGVTAFKEKFGGTVKLFPPEQEYRLKPLSSTLLNFKRKMFG